MAAAQEWELLEEIRVNSKMINRYGLFFRLIVFLFIASHSFSETELCLNLAPNPSFENSQLNIIGWYPLGLTDDLHSALKITDEFAYQGKSSLKVMVSDEEITSGTEYYSSFNAGEGKRQLSNKSGVYGVRTIAYRMDRDIQTFRASVWFNALDEHEISLEVRWFSRFGRRRPVELIYIDQSCQTGAKDAGWRELIIESMRPDGAHQAQLAIITEDNKPFYIDEVNIDLIRREQSLILVDQIGYETGSKAKMALLQQSSQEQPAPTTFQLIHLESQKVIKEARWESLGYLADFDRTYWRADFNDVKTPGNYVIKAKIRSNQIFSVPFTIADSVVIEQAARPAYEFFYYQRCGMAIPGFHAACHMDDAVFADGTYRDLSGGWHDAGDYNKYNGYTPESFYALIQAYDCKKDYFDQFDRNGDGVCDLLDEALWGAAFLEKCIDLTTMRLIGQVSTGYRYWGIPEDETDNKINTGDERPVNDWNGDATHLAVSFALLAKHAPDSKRYIEIAEKFFEKRGGPLPVVIALYDATQKEQYKQQIFDRALKMIEAGDKGVSHFRELAELAIRFPDHDIVEPIKDMAQNKLEQLKNSCDKFFGIIQRGGSDGKRIYFMEYEEINSWYVGGSRELLDAAYDGMLLDKLGLHEGRTIAENQIHWILGLNPFNASMMEGVGDYFVPQYHHRYNTLPACPNGAVIGAVVNGITRSWPWTDRPWLDMNPIPTGEYQCNEPWLPHNNRMLFVLSLW